MPNREAARFRAKAARERQIAQEAIARAELWERTASEIEALHARRSEHSVNTMALTEAEHKARTTWHGMRRRCTNPDAAGYEWYGARGVRVDYPSFDAFVADVGLPPSRRHSIDRIDGDRNYEKGNCRWVLPPEQAANRRPKGANDKVHNLSISKAHAPKEPFVAAINARGYSIRSLAATIGVSQATLQAHRKDRRHPNSRPIPSSRAKKVAELTGWPADAASWPAGLGS